MAPFSHVFEFDGGQGLTNHRHVMSRKGTATRCGSAAAQSAGPLADCRSAHRLSGASTWRCVPRTTSRATEGLVQIARSQANDRGLDRLRAKRLRNVGLRLLRRPRTMARVQTRRRPKGSQQEAISSPAGSGDKLVTLSLEAVGRRDTPAVDRFFHPSANFRPLTAQDRALNAAIGFADPR